MADRILPDVAIAGRTGRRANAWRVRPALPPPPQPRMTPGGGNCRISARMPEINGRGGGGRMIGRGGAGGRGNGLRVDRRLPVSIKRLGRRATPFQAQASLLDQISVSVEGQLIFKQRPDDPRAPMRARVCGWTPCITLRLLLRRRCDPFFSKSFDLSSRIP